MAKRKKEKIVLENIELKPQILGYTFKKKNNIIRVIIIFIAFILVVYYIDDISIFFNNLLGKETATTIKDNANKNNNANNDGENNKKVEYYSYSEDLQIKFNNFTIDNFSLVNNVLTFDVNNLTSETIDVSDKKIYLETYDANKTIIERFKIDINSIAKNSKITLNLNVNSNFNYISILEKSIDEYPALTLEADANGENKIVCTKNKETFTYILKDASLITINHQIIDSDVNSSEYITSLSTYQNKVNSYKEIEGIDSSIASNLAGYTVNITLDLSKVDLSKINEKYYFAYHEDAKVINYEMPTYGFTCNLM